MRLSDEKFLQKALTPTQGPTPRETREAMLSELGRAKHADLAEAVDIAHGAMQPLEAVSFIDGDRRRWGWVVPGGAPEAGVTVVAMAEGGEHVLVPNDCIERRGGWDEARREATRAAARGLLGTEDEGGAAGGALLYRADLVPAGDPVPLGSSGDQHVLVQYSVGLGAPTNEDLRRFVAARFPAARLLDASDMGPGRYQLIMHEAKHEPGTSRGRQPGLIGDHAGDEGGPSIVAGEDAASNAGRGAMTPDPSMGVAAPYSSGQGPLGVREDAHGEYRQAQPNSVSTPASTSTLELGAVTGGEVVETLAPPAPSSTARAARATSSGRRAAPLQTSRPLKEIVEALLVQARTSANAQRQVQNLIASFMQSSAVPRNMLTASQLSMTDMVGSALNWARSAQPKTYQALTNLANIDWTKAPEMRVGPEQQAEIQEAVAHARSQGYTKVKAPEQMTPAEKQQILQWYAKEKKDNVSNVLGPKSTPAAPTAPTAPQAPAAPAAPAAPPAAGGTTTASTATHADVAAWASSVGGRMAGRTAGSGGASAFAQHNLPPTMSTVHRRMRVDKASAQGDYVILRVVWDAEVFAGIGSASVKQQVLSFVKAQASFRDQQNDLGHTGRPRFLVFDPEAGYAEVSVRSSNARGFIPETVARDEVPPYRQRPR